MFFGMEDVAGTKVQLNVKVPEPIRDQLRAYARACGLSVNTTATLVFAQHLSVAGYPALPAVPPKDLETAVDPDTVAQ